MFRLLLIEDEPRILRHLKEKIRTLHPDFKVVGAYNNGEDALVELHWTQPHAILTDIRMPAMDGIELIGKVKERLPDIPCAFLSGYDDFNYLRQAINLGVTDYLLKPASDEEIRDLLDKIKHKLLHNFTLLEQEVAKQIVNAAESSSHLHPEWEPIARELFYHGNYVLLYAWSPVGDVSLGMEGRIETMLREGEKVTLLPPSSGNETIHLCSLHAWSNERYKEWKLVMHSHAVAQDCLTVALAASFSGLQPISSLLAECRKKVRMKSRFEGNSFWLFETAVEDDKLLLEPYQPILIRLAQFISKQQKQLFEKELELLLSGGVGGLPAARKDWETLLLYFSHGLHSLSKDSFSSPFNLKQVMESELSDEIWRARKRADLIAQVKEIWGSYFFRSDHDLETQRNWAQEAKQYVENHFRENISLSTIADVFELHPKYLNRVFKRAFHISIPDYLVQLRIDDACRFIKEFPFVLIKEIAEHVGFTDPFYFSKVFKQYTGFSPTEYKNQNG